MCVSNLSSTAIDLAMIRIPAHALAAAHSQAQAAWLASVLAILIKQLASPQADFLDLRGVEQGGEIIGQGSSPFHCRACCNDEQQPEN